MIWLGIHQPSTRIGIRVSAAGIFYEDAVLSYASQARPSPGKGTEHLPALTSWKPLQAQMQTLAAR